MANSAFLTIEFWTLVIISFALPCLIFFKFIHKRRRRHAHILSFALLLILLAGVDVLLLQQLENVARTTSSLMDDSIFLSGYSLALYILPLVLGTLGSDLLAHVIKAYIIIEHEKEN
ncbi:MAG: hypothetical protein L0Y55_05705 [Anaerolineales bacterium]|nr:hypothetical protein [Anaerolineales bacterium]